MTARFFIVSGPKVKGVRKAEKCQNLRGQDTSRTPKSLKALVFQRFGAGASVGERAARKKKPKDFKGSRSATGHSGRETVLP
ncbi:hypothetical protein EEB18_021500 [Sphingopyxis sp. OPL5]|uniref:hypothetical protein n=1 Tax=Sphingopyxis sp. OPL5 TaxID=2486273 RepID=UPI00164DDEFC|nr:hypothetical protein [Sphingopyxis sp. OPL5]QNO27247.1 hypothetical protein EEB18_021500 [Sphingopyxis sp. OPL5]